MSKRITISFKETTKDMQLYSCLVALEDKSSEIKELIRKGLASQSEVKNV